MTEISSPSEPRRMTDAEIQKVFDKYNALREKESYWVDAGLALVEYLHEKHGMKYRDIYAIAERKLSTQTLVIRDFSLCDLC